MQVILDKEEADLMRDMLRILCNCEWDDRFPTENEIIELRGVAARLHRKSN